MIKNFLLIILKDVLIITIISFSMMCVLIDGFPQNIFKKNKNAQIEYVLNDSDSLIGLAKKNNILLLDMGVSNNINIEDINRIKPDRKIIIKKNIKMQDREIYLSNQKILIENKKKTLKEKEIYIKNLKKKIEDKKKEVEFVKSDIETPPGVSYMDRYNNQVSEYNTLVTKYVTENKAYNEQITELNENIKLFNEMQQELNSKIIN
jgi:hypothetical protein